MVPADGLSKRRDRRPRTAARRGSDGEVALQDLGVLAKLFDGIVAAAAAFEVYGFDSAQSFASATGGGTSPAVAGQTVR